MKSTHLVFILLLSVFIAEKTYALHINDESEQFDLDDLDNLDEDTDYYDEFYIEPEDIQAPRLKKIITIDAKKETCKKLCLDNDTYTEIKKRGCYHNCLSAHF